MFVYKEKLKHSNIQIFEPYLLRMLFINIMFYCFNVLYY